MKEIHLGKHSTITTVFVIIFIFSKTADGDKETADKICSFNDECMDPSVTSSSCHCDEKCFLYGDCCRTASHRKESYSPIYKCTFMDYFMVSYCPQDTVPELKELCERDFKRHLLSLVIPVTDASTKITYKNHFCAQCNGVEKSNRLWWTAHFEYPDIAILKDFYTAEELSFMIYFDKEKSDWGIRDNKTGTNIFYPSYITPDKPKSLNSSESLRQCQNGWISSCNETWEDEEVKKKCHSFQAPVNSSNKVVYKNAYCALCNGIPLSELTCFQASSGNGEAERELE